MKEKEEEVQNERSQNDGENVREVGVQRSEVIFNTKTNRTLLYKY